MSITSWKPRVRFVLSIAISAAVLLWIAEKIAAANDYMLNWDFFSYWLVGQFNWTGENPYDLQSWLGGYNAHHVTNIIDNTFLYPLPLALLFAPFGRMTLATAATAWSFLSMAMILLAIALLFSNWDKINGWAYILPALAAVSLFRPMVLTMIQGQLAGFLLLLVAAATWCWQRERWFAGGFLLGVLILKPNIGAPVLALAAIWLLGSRRWTALAGMLAAGLALLLVGLLQDPHWVSEYLGIGSHKMNMTLGFNPSGWGIAGAVCGHADLCTLRLGFSAAVLTGLPLVVLLWRAGSRLRPAVAMGIIVASALLLTPYLWAYDHLLLVVPLVAAMGLLAERRSPYLLAATTPILFAVLALALAAIAGTQGHDSWSGLLPLVVVGLVVGLAGSWVPAHFWFIRRPSLSKRASS